MIANIRVATSSTPLERLLSIVGKANRCRFTECFIEVVQYNMKDIHVRAVRAHQCLTVHTSVCQTAVFE